MGCWAFLKCAGLRRAGIVEECIEFKRVAQAVEQVPHFSCTRVLISAHRHLLSISALEYGSAKEWL